MYIMKAGRRATVFGRRAVPERIVAPARAASLRAVRGQSARPRLSTPAHKVLTRRTPTGPGAWRRLPARWTEGIVRAVRDGIGARVRALLAELGVDGPAPAA